ncbi:MAG: HPr family phosphocarrier protein [Elusimicrobia bacterium]|nr:HPr family phosphocarrier protein [Elusimicrobiota bacterium]MBU2615271.1 HPr family phosphocarrier protein [Elusimicrobiota bacterium]
MQETNLTVRNKLGLHARPAAMFVQLTTKYKSAIKVFKGDQEVDGKSIMGLMTLAAEMGSQIKIVAEGEDEQDLINGISELVENRFNED